jgi:sugar-specific transcriptional regulator TrmB
MNKVSVLEQLGLNKHESEIYVSLLLRGPQIVAGIQKHTGLHRPTVYQGLRELKELGLVATSQRGKRTFFVAGPPQRIQFLFDDLNNRFQAFLQDLESIRSSHKNKPSVRFYEGRRGVGAVFQDLVTTLNRGETYYRITSSGDFPLTGKYVPKSFKKLRDSKEIQRYVITNKETFERKVKEKNLNREIKMIPTDFDALDFNITELMYKNKIAFIDFNTETAFIVENQKIADFQKKLFKLLYSKL